LAEILAEVAVVMAACTPAAPFSILPCRLRGASMTPKLALYYCRLAQQKTLNDQAVAIMDEVFERKDAERAAAIAAKRGQIRRVK
jgi:hypothetical protein